MGEFDQHEGEAQTIVNLVEAAMHYVQGGDRPAAFPEDKKFQKRAEVVLTGMRKLRGVTEGLPQPAHSPVMMALSDVRRRYDDLMERGRRPRIDTGSTAYNARIHAVVGARGGPRVWTRRELPDELEEGDAQRAGNAAGRAADRRDPG
jgi:hypothetical protein